MGLERPLLICVVGPTAIGKTALAIALANAFSTEIISADSRQFFKEMSIGTAVPTADELKAAPHHFIQHTTIFESYSVGNFEKEALLKLDELYKKHSVVVLAGGSGLYVDSVVRGLDEFPEVPSEIREQLNSELRTGGIEPLQKELAKVDPESYSKIEIQNSRRLIRALEIYRASGKPFSSYLKKKASARSFDTLYIGLTADRSIIYDRINKRVDKMIADGLLEEAEALFTHRTLNALQTVGYRELFSYFDGDYELETAIEEIKKNTRRFAKRQGTWFQKNTEINWFDHLTNYTDIVQFIKEKKAL